MPHSVENCHTRRYRATRGVDIDGDVLLLISCVQVQQLRLCQRTPWAFQSAPPLQVTLAAACWSLKRETSYSSQDGSSHHDEIRHVVIDRPSQPHNPLQAHHSRFVQFRNQECGVNLMAGAMSSMLA